jgi:hypothetical protein
VDIFAAEGLEPVDDSESILWRRMIRSSPMRGDISNWGTYCGVNLSGTVKKELKRCRGKELTG